MAIVMVAVPLSVSEHGDATAVTDTGAYMSFKDLSYEDYTLLEGSMKPVTHIELNLHPGTYSDYAVQSLPSYVQGMARSVDGNKEMITNISEKKVEFDMRIEFINDHGDLISDQFETDYSILNTYLGISSIAVGDVLEVSGTYESMLSISVTTTYAGISGDRFVPMMVRGDSSDTNRIDIDVRYLPGGNEEEAKGFSYLYDYKKLAKDFTEERIYDSPLTEVDTGSAYTMRTSCSNITNSLSVILTFDGTGHDISPELPPLFEEEARKTLEIYDIAYASQFESVYPVSLDDLVIGSLSGEALKDKVASIGTYGETESSVKDMASSLIADHFPSEAKKGDNTMFIIGAVLGIIVVIGIAVFFKRRA